MREVAAMRRLRMADRSFLGRKDIGSRHCAGSAAVVPGNQRGALRCDWRAERRGCRLCGREGHRVRHVAESELERKPADDEQVAQAHQGTLRRLARIGVELPQIVCVAEWVLESGDLSKR